NLIEAEQASHKIGLAAQQQAGDEPGGVPELAPVQMPAVDRQLGGDQFVVELGERQARRQHRVLDDEQAIIAGLQPAPVGDPALGPRIGSVDADIDDIRHIETPIANDLEALMVPIRVGDQVYRDVDAERAGKFDGFEIAAERDAFAEFPKPLLVDRFETEKHRDEAEPLPQAERFFVAQQHIAASLQVIPLADAGASDCLTDFQTVPLMDKGDVVDNKNAGLADRFEILDDPFRADQPIAATVKGPRAA